MAVFTYACPNCDIWFDIGVEIGRENTSLNLDACTTCGLMYQIEASQYSKHIKATQQVADTIGIIMNPSIFWKSNDNRDQHLVLPKYHTLPNGIIEYLKSDLEIRQTEIDNFMSFTGVSCKSCNNRNTINLASHMMSGYSTCTRCKKAQLKAIDMWIT